MKKMRKGFTLVEIMIVVAIIGLLAAIAIPSFVKSRNTSRKSACINNLRQIDSAKEQWAMETNAADDAAPTSTNIVGYLKALPICPSDAAKTFDSSYTISIMNINPLCKIDPGAGKHSL